MSNITMKQLPESERPYERLLNCGESNLSDAELIAIILKNGTKNETSVELARNIILLAPQHRLENIHMLSIEELKNIKGIGTVKAIQIRAVMELAKRINKPFNVAKIKIKGAQDVYDTMRSEIIHLSNENIYLLSLNRKNDIIKISEVAKGGRSSVIVDMKQLFVDPIKVEASAIILVHNHPSGDTTPSSADISFTMKVSETAKLLNMDFLDHIIISPIGYTSLKQQNII